MTDEDDDAEQFQEELNDALEGGGCTEIWEKLSENRERENGSSTVDCGRE